MLNSIRIVVLVIMSMYVLRQIICFENFSFLFDFKYLGSVEVLCSMKTLDFENRTKVARDSIRLVCAAIGVTLRERRKVEKKQTDLSVLTLVFSLCLISRRKVQSNNR